MSLAIAIHNLAFLTLLRSLATAAATFTAPTTSEHPPLLHLGLAKKMASAFLIPLLSLLTIVHTSFVA